MISLSTRAKEAIKTGLAMAIAYGIALWMDWDKPHWAGFAVAMISLSTAGQSLNKGAMRMFGTLIAAVAALTFLAWFPQERWLLMIALSVYVGICTYMLTGKKWQYAWFVSAFVCLVIVVNAGTTSQQAFQTAVERVQETGTGVLVYSLVASLLWPQSTRGELEETTRKLFATQLQLYRTYRTLMIGQGANEDSRPLRMQESQLLTRVGQALSAAETDSYEVWEVRHQWRRFLGESSNLMETLERWRTSIPELKEIHLRELLPNVDSVSDEIDLRLAQIERMLAGEAPERMPQAIDLTIDTAKLRSLSHFQKAAVAVTKDQLDRLEGLSRSLFECVADLRGYLRQGLKPDHESNRPSWVAIDPDRVTAAVRVVATLWIAFLIWIYVDPPGHEAFVQLTVTMAMGVAMMPQLRATSMLLPFAFGCVVAGALYLLVMPHLAGFAQLAPLIFGATFAIYYLFSEPRHALKKLGAIVPVVSFTFIENDQSYDFAKYLNATAQMMLCLALVVATAYIPTSPRPEKVFLRLLSRFFRHAEFLMSRMAPDWKPRRDVIGRWRSALHGNDLLELPTKLAAWGGKIDHRTFPDNKPEQVQALVGSLYVLAHRINALLDAGERAQAELLVRELRDDVRPWRLLAEEQFRLWAENPETAIERGVDVQERLTTRLARLEARIEETFRLAGEGELRAEDYENFYRLLGSYRGLSESGIGYIRLAEKINWAQWREARF